MSFFVDVVSEDAFYENLTLGVTKVLENSPCVKNVFIERRTGCDKNAIANWEQRHCCALPEDLKNFYISIDGFLLTWSLKIAGEEFPVGRMQIGTLSSLKRYITPNKERQTGTSRSEATAAETEVEMTRGSESIAANTLSATTIRNSKLFEIARCCPATADGKVYLAYRSKAEHEAPQIWYHQQSSDQWYCLTDSFTKYFRMMLAHLGLPMWQSCVLGLPLPTWVEQVYFLVGPHLLPDNIEVIETISASIWNNGPPNVLDPNVFKGKESKQKSTTRKTVK